MDMGFKRVENSKASGKSNTPPLVFETEQLAVRTANEADVDFFYTLWMSPDVMKYVGFPNGLPITKEEIRNMLYQQGKAVFDQMLVVELKQTGQVIGECKLPQSDENGIIEPDIKLLPAHWGSGFGGEVWMNMVSYLFENTDCDVIQTTPNVENQAAINIYEAAGAIREGEDVYYFPEQMRDFTTPVHCYIYRLYRSRWSKLER